MFSPAGVIAEQGHAHFFSASRSSTLRPVSAAFLENATAVFVTGGDQVKIVTKLGGAVYVADGRGVTHTHMSEQARGHTLCLFDVALHVLNHGTGFDLNSRRPFKAAEVGTSVAPALQVP
jgi:cyanophycinase-like exopeptidase